MTPEGKIKEQVKKLLSGYNHYRFMPVPSGYGETTVDFLVCYKGRFIAIETKAPGKKPTPRQLMILECIKVAGGHTVVVADDEGLEQLRTLMDNIKL